MNVHYYDLGGEILCANCCADVLHDEHGYVGSDEEVLRLAEEEEKIIISALDECDLCGEQG
jgi:hypothetical protein